MAVAFHFLVLPNNSSLSATVSPLDKDILSSTENLLEIV